MTPAAGVILAELYPGKIFYHVAGRRFEDFTGPVPASEVKRKSSCLALRANFRPELAPLLIRQTLVESLYAVPAVDAVVGPEAAATE